jgi:hypothetical protein
MTGASSAPASHTEHFANRNDPFWLVFNGRCVKPLYGGVFLCQLFSYICSPIRINDTSRPTI